jgi:hypothetical protein
VGEVNTNRDYRFDVDFQTGLSAEIWFYEMCHGGDRYEVKRDARALETGNLYVEYQHDPGRTGQWQLCGIATTEADCWIFALGDPPHAFIGIEVERLKTLARSACRRGDIGEQPFGSCPTKAALVKLDDALGRR